MYDLKLLQKLWNEKKTVIQTRVRLRTRGDSRVGITVFLFFLVLPYLITAVGFQGSGKYGNKLANEEISKIKVQIKMEEGVSRLDMETFLIGRLAVAIPAEYEEETLKAQAILLRTSIIQEYKEGVNQGLGREVFLEEQENFFWNILQMRSQWGSNFVENYEKICLAVKETKGIYVTYQGEPILASFFRVSNGKTKDMGELLGDDLYPYLKSVVCPKDYLSEDYLHNGTPTGLGHGVGMSQFGANEMAKSGSTYDEILNYFFTDIAIDKFE